MFPLLGITLKVISGVAFTAMSALIKAMSAEFPVGQLVFVRSFFAMIPLLLWLGWIGHISDIWRPRSLTGHLRRGVIGSTGMFLGFAALGLLPLPDAVAIGYAAPLIVVVLASLVLGETVRIYRWSAVAVGFGGVLLMLSPHLAPGQLGRLASGGPALGAVFALAGAVCSAFATIEIRRLTRTETTGAIVFYFMLLTTLLGLSTALFGWTVPRDAWSWFLLAMIGILGGVGQILMTMSYRHGDASLIAPFDYMQMIWAVLLGWFVFGEFPLPVVLAGAGIVILAGLFVIWREQRLGLLASRPREVEAAPLK